jgi:hypothetical protein
MNKNLIEGQSFNMPGIRVERDVVDSKILEDGTVLNVTPIIVKEKYKEWGIISIVENFLFKNRKTI